MSRFISAFVFFAFLLSFQAAYACSCRVGGYWVSEFVDDKVVFEGQVLQTKWRGEKGPEGPFMNNSESTFKTIQTFKGKTTSEMLIRHHSHGAACGMFFVMGSDEIIVARVNDNGIATTNSCASEAIPKITLLDYFEKDIDTYIPSIWECPDEQIENMEDPKNCHFWSDEAEAQRREAMSKRWSEKREKALEKKKKTN